MPQPFLPFELKNIIFDLDGVLVDSEGLHTRAKNETLSQFGLNVSPNIYDQFKGQTDAMFFQKLLELNPSWKKKVDLATLVDTKADIFIRLYPQLQPIPDVKSFIAMAVEKNLCLSVVTSATELSQQYAFQLLQLSNEFSFVVNASHVKRHKPAPDPYLYALQLLSDRTCTLVIEDSPSGIASAKGAGLFVVGLTTTFPADEVDKAGADRIVESFQELIFKLGWVNHSEQ